MATKIAELYSSSFDSTAFNWVIENFSKLNAEGGVTSSDVFSVGSFKWKAKIYPKGNMSDDHLSLYLHPVDLTTSVEADFSVQVTSQSDPCNTVTRETTRKFPDKNYNSLGWKKFMRLNELHDPNKGYIVNDTCVLTVEVTCTMQKEPKTLATNIADLYSSTKFNWTIENMTKWNTKARCAFSDVFCVGSFKWKAVIYPKGNKEGCDDLSLFLYPVDLRKSVDTKYSFAVISQTGENNVRRELTRVFPNRDFNAWGWPRFMSHSELYDPDKGYLVNDTCVIAVEVTCPMMKETEDDDDDDENESQPNKATKKEKDNQAKEKDDRSSSKSEEYPGAGKPFGEGRHDYKIGGADKEFEDVGGFSILKTQAPLYRKIWLKYGHIPSTKVMPISSCSLLVMAVKDLMNSIIEMHHCHYVDLSSEMINSWEEKIKMAEKFEFNIGWLRERFETVKMGMGGMQNVKAELLEHGQPLRAAKEKMKILSNAIRKVEVQLTEAMGYVRENTSGLLSESDMEMYLEIGENLLLDGLY